MPVLPEDAPRRASVPPPPAARGGQRPSDVGRWAEQLRAEAVARLRPSCDGLTPDAFDALVRDVVAFRLRWELPPGARGRVL